MSDIIVSNFEREQRKRGRANDEKKKVSGHCAYRHIYIHKCILYMSKKLDPNY